MLRDPPTTKTAVEPQRRRAGQIDWRPKTQEAKKLTTRDHRAAKPPPKHEECDEQKNTEGNAETAEGKGGRKDFLKDFELSLCPHFPVHASVSRKCGVCLKNPRENV